MISAYTGTHIRDVEQQLLETSADPGDGRCSDAAGRLRARQRGGPRTPTPRAAGPTAASVTVLAGKGNNGGDGLYAAALLARRGMRTTAVLTAGAGPPGRAGGLPRRRRPGHAPSTDGNAAELAAGAAGADVVIDAVLGTGAQGGLRGAPPAAAGSNVARPAPRGTSGAGTAWWWPATSPAAWTPTPAKRTRPSCAADVTVTFGAAKAGLLADPGADFAGRMRTIPIGIEDALARPELRRLEAADLAALLPQPGRRSHKYSRGVLGVVAGSARYPGAAVLACRGALAAGAGMVRYVGPPEVARPGPPVLPRSGVRHVRRRRARPGLARSGPGLDDGADEQLERVREAAAAGLPTVADAGALPALPRDLSARTVLTPHAGELAALLDALRRRRRRGPPSRTPRSPPSGRPRS